MGDDRSRIPIPCRVWLAVVSRLVPEWQRGDWRREWRAELWHRGRSPAGALRTTTFALGALPHALRLRKWSLDMIRQDLRSALRALRRSPGTAAAAILALGLGIGAATAVFSMVNAALWRPYPYPDPQRLVAVRSSAPRQGIEKGNVSYPDFLDVRDRAETFESMAAWQWASFNLAGRGEARRIIAYRVSRGFFRVLGFEPLLGRTFLPEEDAPGGPDVAVLSHGLWRERFGADREVVGRTVLLDGEPHVVVGVMPEEVEFPGGDSLWTPLGLGPDSWPRYARIFQVVGRLDEGVSVERARTELAAIGDSLAVEHPETNEAIGQTAVSLRDYRIGDTSGLFLLLLGAVGALLLIVCSNVASLMLARATGRRREMAVRSALGASRSALVRQVLTESLVMAASGCALGIVVARWGVSALLGLAPELPGWFQVSIDSTALAFTAGVAALSALAFGLAPALSASRTDPRRELAASGERASGAPGILRSRSILVAGEIALSVTLLFGAGLMVRSFVELTRVDPGFRAEGALTVSVDLPDGTYPEEGDRVSFIRRLEPRLRALPGVEAVGAVTRLPLRGPNTWGVQVEGQSEEEARENPSLPFSSATPELFRALGVPVLAGRTFTEADGPDGMPGVIVNRRFAERFWPGQEAVGRRIRVGATGNWSEWLRIVGVVGDVRVSLREEPRIHAYLPMSLDPGSTMSLVIRTSNDPSSLVAPVRREIGELDASVAPFDVMTLEELVRREVWLERFVVQQMWVFAVVALGLAMMGTYGVTSYVVGRRTREMGIRMALGARGPDVVRLVMARGFLPVLAGLVLGVGGAAALGTALEGILHGVGGLDPVVLAGVCAALLATSGLALWLPARRAVGVDPLVALRNE